MASKLYHQKYLEARQSGGGWESLEIEAVADAVGQVLFDTTLEEKFRALRSRMSTYVIFPPTFIREFTNVSSTRW